MCQYCRQSALSNRTSHNLRNQHAPSSYTSKVANDRKFVINLVSKHKGQGTMLQYLPFKWQDDLEVVEAAIKRDTRAYQYASERIRSMPDLGIKVCKLNGHMLEFIIEHVAEPFVFTTNKKKALVTQYLTDNEQFFKYHIVQHCPLALQFASNRVRSNIKDIISVAARANGLCLLFAHVTEENRNEFDALVDELFNTTASNFTIPKSIKVLEELVSMVHDKKKKNKSYNYKNVSTGIALCDCDSVKRVTSEASLIKILKVVNNGNGLRAGRDIIRALDIYYNYNHNNDDKNNDNDSSNNVKDKFKDVMLSHCYSNSYLGYCLTDTSASELIDDEQFIRTLLCLEKHHQISVNVTNHGILSYCSDRLLTANKCAMVWQLLNSHVATIATTQAKVTQLQQRKVQLLLSMHSSNNGNNLSAHDAKLNGTINMLASTIRNNRMCLNAILLAIWCRNKFSLCWNALWSQPAFRAFLVSQGLVQYILQPQYRYYRGSYNTSAPLTPAECITAMKADGYALRYMVSNFESATMLHKLVQMSTTGSAIDIALYSLESNANGASQFDFIDRISGINSQAASSSSSSSSLFKCREVALKAVSYSTSFSHVYNPALREFTDEFGKDREIVQVALICNANNYLYMDETLKQDRDFVLLTAMKYALFNYSAPGTTTSSITNGLQYLAKSWKIEDDGPIAMYLLNHCFMQFQLQTKLWKICCEKKTCTVTIVTSDYY